MAKFEVGEVALINASPTTCEWWNERDGTEVTIIGRGFYFEYEVLVPFDHPHLGGRDVFCNADALRKRRPPEQPADEDFQRDLDKWLKRDREVVA